MITIATPEDMKRAIGLANGFASQKVDETTFVDWWSEMISKGLATVFYRENNKNELKEALGVLVFTHPLTGKKAATVTFWFCDFEDTSLARGIMFRRAEEFMKSLGCQAMYVSALIDPRYQTVHNFLTTNGFVPLEVQFRKDI